ncbi:MAG TPA: nuclear transport factor 2 family protein [Candidatus Limnocylindria bacterium]|nr:nuclear transport factor 2 family protein [Candidatus Limnocylindria bacterium]
MATPDEIRTLFDRRRAAWLREDLPAYLACFADDLVFASPVHDPPLVGLPAFADLVRRSSAALRPESFDVHALAVDGEQVLAEWTITVEARAGGRRIRWRGMSIATYRPDGRIATWREYWNPADLTATA